LKQRLASIDAFRGFTIAAMVLVNNPGSWSHIYAPLDHAAWHGWTPTDLIFPFFLFIVGVVVPFSLSAQVAAGASRKSMYTKIVRRTAILFGLGLMLNGFPYYDLSTIRIPGVLQRIAVVYCVTAFVTLKLRPKGQAVLAASLLLLYWMAMTLIPVPGHGAGDLSPAGNLAAFVDNHLLHGHTWKKTWDPEGLLSTIPAISTALSGVLTGHLLRSGRDRRDIAGWMFVSGWIAIIVGIFWSIFFPINKSLWTSSYVVFTSGAALQALGVCYWLIDVKGIRRWAKPAIIFGMNAIALFVLSGLLGRIIIRVKVHDAAGNALALKTWIYQTLFASSAGPLNGSLAFAIFNIFFWLGMMTVLYRRRVFIKI